ncbi:bis(5'-adenosyl)-triphosphatase enpp4-like [Planococcus citri]|uniref:bis(5'-adenosyl)-triphosphatase enpp4-like n=1 Tax=Planococcus citri TaxID=170843 RepID=UPI0031F8256C
MSHRSVIVAIFVALSTIAFVSQGEAVSTHPIIVIFGFDGFRYDYLKRGLNPVLKDITERGVSTDFLMNVFPTKTFTNFFSIATGMYAEAHGVLANKVFSENGTCLKYSYEMFHYNEDIVPIWTLNEKTGEGRHSGCMMWPGCDYPYQNINLTYFQKYNNTIKWTDRIDMMMTWLLDPEKPMNLLNAYFEQPDAIGHAFGPYSEKTNEKLKQVDEILLYFFEKLNQQPELKDRINLIVLSDHGMVEIKTDKIINISALMDPETYTKCGDSPVIQILPKPGFEDAIYQNLTLSAQNNKTFKIYKKEEMPDFWYWKNNRRNIGLYAASNPCYSFDDNPTQKGNHGYVPGLKNMRAFFTAIGPIFRQPTHVTWLHNIDIYPLISYVLKLESPPEHVKPNGTLAKIKYILKDD